MGVIGGRALSGALRIGGEDAKRSRPPAALQPLDRGPSLTEAAADRLRAMIIDGTLPAGAALTEAALAQTLRVSKTPVREALALLKAEGLVTIAPHRGTFVFQPSPEEIEPICAHWATLAGAALRAAAMHDAGALVPSLRTVQERLAAASAAMDATAFIRAEGELHAALFDHCGNPFLSDAYRLIAAKILAIRVAAGEPAAALPAALADLGALPGEVAAGRIEAAAARLDARIAAVSRHLSAALGSRAAKAPGSVGRLGAFLMGWEAFAEDAMLMALEDMPTLMALLPPATLLN